jgi:g-D-glutamyl-meso-diaminopimelate peptidase
MEWITTVLLLRFINEYAEYYKSHRRIFNINLEYLFRSRLVCVVPMLNPDGVELQIHGAKDAPNKEKLVEMNRGSEDFTHWQANGRGVDLNHNYNAGFAAYKELERSSGLLGGAPTRYSGEYPESEPEVGALANYIRFDDSIKMILTLHTQGEEIYYTSGGKCPPKSKNIARLLSQMSGYTLSEAMGMAAFGGLTDWAIQDKNLPSFTIECGKGVNPLPSDTHFSIYAAIREMLFTAPILI